MFETRVEKFEKDRDRDVRCSILINDLALAVRNF